MIAEGVGDIIAAVKTAVIGTWAVQKAVSLTVPLMKAGMNFMTAEHKIQTTKIEMIQWLLKK
jgi:hypothetical protein